MNFNELGLNPEILAGITELGFKEPTPVQAEVIPELLSEDTDLVALAQTGTGKTAAFGLPILHMTNYDRKAVQALVLCPTRELCMQITKDLKSFAKYTPKINILAVYGGVDIQKQLTTLSKGVHVIVATPGRMCDILRREKADLSKVKRVILDEADEMLNMGFEEDIEAILSKAPKDAQTLLFSATMPTQVAKIASNYMKNPKEITIGRRNAGSENVTHEYYMVDAKDRYPALKRIADYYPDMYCIVFCRTRRETQQIADRLIADGYNADSLHGDLSQLQRDRVMDKFRTKSIQILVATDVAARGLDVNDLTHVINYTFPDDLGSYTHRSGRTGRAGKAGISVAIIHKREKNKINIIEKNIDRKFEHRPVPTGRQVCEARLLSLVERVKHVDIDHSQIESYLPAIIEDFKGMSWEEVIQRFISLEFNRFLEYYKNAKDLNAKPGKEGKRRDQQKGNSGTPGATRMFINLGRLDDLNPPRLSKLIQGTCGKNVDVQRVDIMKGFSFFEIPNKDVKLLVSNMCDVVVNDRSVRVEPVEDKKRNKRSKSRPNTSNSSRHGKPGRRRNSEKPKRRNRN